MRINASLWLSAILLAACVWPSSSFGQQRVALLIGNEGYTEEIGRLKNPHNDVELIGSALKSVGFEVIFVRDAGLAALHQALNAYLRRIRGAGRDAIGFFYYSGHGAQDATTGTNYLIPTDVTAAADEELWDRSLPLTEITHKLKAEAGNATHFVVIDACRNGLRLRKAGSRALLQPKGFVPISQESGMLIAYATAEGELASDVGDYAKILAEELVRPGVEAVNMFRRVQVRVRAAIGQEPWLGFNVLPEVHFAGLPTPTVSVLQLSEAERTWPLVEETNNESILEAYNKQFRDTVYGAMARAKLEELRRQHPASDIPRQSEPSQSSATPPPALKATPIPAPHLAATRDPSGPTSAWVKLCEPATTSTRENDGRETKKTFDICLTHHERLDGNTGMVLVSAAVRQIQGQEKQAFMVMVPLGMLLQPGMRAAIYPKDAWEKVQRNEKIDEAKLKTITLAYTLCHPAGCTAETEATPGLIADLKANSGLVVLAVNASGQAVGFPVPLSGFEEAYKGKPIDSKEYAKARQALLQQITAHQKELAAAQQKNAKQ